MRHTLGLDDEKGIGLGLDVFGTVPCPLFHKGLTIARVPKGNDALVLSLIGQQLAIGMPVHGGASLIDPVFHGDSVIGF